MRRLPSLSIVLLLVAGLAAATELAPRPPIKPRVASPPNQPAADPLPGDTIADALVIPGLPFIDARSTIGYTDNYDEECPYGGSISPDVVYVFTPATDMMVKVDLCGSSYDTKLFVYDDNQHLVACNDDFYSGPPCGDYVSALESVFLDAGRSYYIVVDGYFGDYGDYQLAVTAHPLCVLAPPDGSVLEGEPPLGDGYQDNFNSGCDHHPILFQELAGDAQGNLVFCGVAGWYFTPSGVEQRDKDWFHVYAGPAGDITLTADAEFPTLVAEMAPQYCLLDLYDQFVIVGDCAPETMTIWGYSPGHVIWLRVCSSWSSPPNPTFDNEYDYVLWFSGLMPTVATERTTWGAVKALYD